QSLLSFPSSYNGHSIQPYLDLSFSVPIEEQNGGLEYDFRYQFHIEPRVVVCAYNPSTQETEAHKSLADGIFWIQERFYGSGNSANIWLVHGLEQNVVIAMDLQNVPLRCLLQ
ncbi:hypothetical protein STEG23_029700, partial [Scotinomys teguina]